MLLSYLKSFAKNWGLLVPYRDIPYSQREDPMIEWEQVLIALTY